MEPMPSWFLEAFQHHFLIDKVTDPETAAKAMWRDVEKKLHIVNKHEYQHCPEHDAPLSPRGQAGNHWLYCPYCPDKLYTLHQGKVVELVETGGCAPPVVSPNAGCYPPNRLWPLEEEHRTKFKNDHSR